MNSVFLAFFSLSVFFCVFYLIYNTENLSPEDCKDDPWFGED
jgi:hypothetical protein